MKKLINRFGKWLYSRTSEQFETVDAGLNASDFLFDRRFKTIGHRIESLEKCSIPTPLVTCENCGCAVIEASAIKGKPEVRETSPAQKAMYSISDAFKSGLFGRPIKTPVPEYFLFYPHYCKACAPKGQKGGEGKSPC